jgi:hypothetical protein
MQAGNAVSDALIENDFDFRTKELGAKKAAHFALRTIFI